MIRVNAFITTSEANRAEVVRIAKEMVAATHTEKDNIAYDLFESTTRRDVLMFCETWPDMETLAAHSQTPHYTTLMPQLRKLCEIKTEKIPY